MRRTILVVFILFGILLSSCSHQPPGDAEKGLENFSTNDSEYSLCRYLMPDGFIEKYHYEDGNYYGIEIGSILKDNVVDRTLVYIQYDAETYNDAKSYAMENLSLSPEPIHEYNEYYFFLNQDYCSFLTKNNYPYQFISFAYNDDINVLIFFGLYASTPSKEKITEEAMDWPAFLEKYYGEWYSFS